MLPARCPQDFERLPSLVCKKTERMDRVKSKASPAAASATKKSSGPDLPGKRQARSPDSVRSYVDFGGVHGKIVDRVLYSPDTIENQSFEVRFSDGTFLFIEPVIELRYRVRHLRMRNGKVEPVQDFGVVPSNE
jgi:hypothetical protein